ncbi:DUF4350 domain-containing protein [Aquabacterium sp.]|uniref:DUF4350 domain-containing protein n=1 Tax=Aquabacterium sp. TaxID=1872578 RepID=UPI0035AFAB9E
MSATRTSRATRWLPRALLAVLLAGIGYGVLTQTEWVDEEVPVPRSREVIDNAFYAVQHLIERLGGRAVRQPSLQHWPPQDATMLLTSSHWKLFPERLPQLKNWVEAGGQLVIPADLARDDALRSWLGIQSIDTDEADAQGVTPPVPASAAVDDTAPECTGTRCRRWARYRALARCHRIAETADATQAYSERRSFTVCSANTQVLTAQREVSWRVGDAAQTVALRMPVGRGSVSVLQAPALLNNDALFRGDHALLAVALLQVRPGHAVWFVEDEARTPLPLLIWNEARVAVLLVLLAVGGALWRGAVRFGPLMAPAPLGRRSMAEQVRGTAQFLWQRDPAALHAAQLRALHEVAEPRLRGYARQGAAERAAALARATGLDEPALAQALDTRRNRTPAHLAATLNLLESARRRLRLRRAAD